MSNVVYMQCTVHVTIKQWRTRKSHNYWVAGAYNLGSSVVVGILIVGWLKLMENEIMPSIPRDIWRPLWISWVFPLATALTHSLGICSWGSSFWATISWLISDWADPVYVNVEIWSCQKSWPLQVSVSMGVMHFVFIGLISGLHVHVYLNIVEVKNEE